MMELLPNQLSKIMTRFPQFELSYETNLTNQRNDEYDLAVAIPSGKKSYAWFTFHEDKDVCYLLDLNKDKKISKASEVSISSKTIDPAIFHGTIIYGTIVDINNNGISWFLVEDVYFYKGVPMKKCTFSDKLNVLADFMASFFTQNNNATYRFVLPLMWLSNECMPSDIAYVPHHIQHRSMHTICPYMNEFINRKMNTVSESKKAITPVINVTNYKMDFAKPQYKYTTIFQVTADIQFDIYNLFAFGKNKQVVFYNIAYIPNYKSSVFLNGLFRKIRENQNLDYIEESDDDDDFQNLAEDKYVDLNKSLLMECVFHTKFKRWIPIKVVDKRAKVVHISQLVRDYY